MWMSYQEKHTDLPMGVLGDIRRGGWFRYDIFYIDMGGSDSTVFPCVYGAIRRP